MFNVFCCHFNALSLPGECQDFLGAFPPASANGVSAPPAPPIPDNGGLYLDYLTIRLEGVLRVLRHLNQFFVAVTHLAEATKSAFLFAVIPDSFLLPDRLTRFEFVLLIIRD